MSSTFGYQCQGYPDIQLLGEIRRSGAIHYLQIDPGPIRPNIPLYMITSARLHHGPGEPDKEWVHDGAAGAERWWRECERRIRIAWWIKVWGGPNEFVVRTEEDAHALVDFETRRIELLHAAGLQAGSYSFSTGNPEPKWWRILGEGLRHTDYLWLHEYGEHSMNMWTGHLGRYRQAFAALRDAGYEIPQTVITETGCDLRGRKLIDGWRKWMTEAEFLAGLVAYERATRRDPQIVGITPFIWRTRDWISFRMDGSMSRRYTDYLEEQNMADTLFEQNLGNLMQAGIVRQTPSTAFYKYGATQGWPPAIGNERDWRLNGVDYRAQVFYTRADNMQHIAYTEVDNWANVRHFDRKN